MDEEIISNRKLIIFSHHVEDPVCSKLCRQFKISHNIISDCVSFEFDYKITSDNAQIIIEHKLKITQFENTGMHPYPP